jgi:hypothetical protein
MNVLVVYESMYGNTRAVAEAIAEELGGAPVRSVHEAATSPEQAGTAARGIARRLRRRGYDVIATESFLVEDAEGPLEDGELERARAWGADPARRLQSG